MMKKPIVKAWFYWKDAPDGGVIPTVRFYWKGEYYNVCDLHPVLNADNELVHCTIIPSQNGPRGNCEVIQVKSDTAEADYCDLLGISYFVTVYTG